MGGGRLEVAFRSDREGNRCSLVGAQNVAVAGVAGVGQQPFVARIGERGKGKVQCAGSAVGNGDAIGRDGHAVTFTVESGDCSTQFG
ncbi:hypothetical protein SDC9_164258 [bioreactor metagenome]|uniref:Uncharacterized protein n=1 Tax=bioreactor metagenome TaxID=1076179 RepID=A0A645FR65_9ZZZZ